MLNIRIVGSEGTPEYEAVKQLKFIFERDIPDNQSGEITLISNVTCFGQETKDIDIVVFGRFFTKFDLQFKSKGKKERQIEDFSIKNIRIKDFCFCIEVKDHPPDKVEFQGSRLLVRYKNKLHDATDQSEKQKYSLKNYLVDTIEWSPYICNFIWIRNIPGKYLPSIAHNWLPVSPTINWIFQLACVQNIPYFCRQENIYSLSCTRGNKIIDGKKLEECLSLFTKIQRNLGYLTRAKLEKITKTTLLKEQKYVKAIGEKLVLIRGRAGTGKTIKLVHIAHDLCVREEQRCLILTYNKALVSDIQRLIALARVSTDISTATISIKTIHAFMYSLMEGFGILTSINKKLFLENYEKLKHDLLLYVREGLVTSSDIQSLMKKKHDEVAWEKILVDESQDWPDDEKEILFTIFDSKNFIIADGVDQLIRDLNRTRWIDGINYHKLPDEKRSLRQKANLCRFIQYYAEQVNINWDLEPKEDLNGGRVVILDKEYSKDFHSKLLEDCIKSGNQPYEMLFVVPPSLVIREPSRKFAWSSLWKEWGIKIWDGTAVDIRSNYPKDVEEHRVIQYDSCRGLEGWIVVCFHLDEFIKYKLETFDISSGKDEVDVALFSINELRSRFAYRWSMIPLTRAIDTLVITLKDPESETSKLLKNLFYKFSDFVEWID